MSDFDRRTVCQVFGALVYRAVGGLKELLWRFAGCGTLGGARFSGSKASVSEGSRYKANEDADGFWL